MPERAHSYAELSDKAKRCRSLGHSWKPFDAEKRPRQYWWVTLACSNCTCFRSYLMDRRGYIVPNTARYRYPDNYIATFSIDQEGGKGRMRLESLLPVLNHDPIGGKT